MVDAALLRADARENVLTIIRCLGWAGGQRTTRTRPTVARLMAVSGRSKRCVQQWLRWLEDRGLLEVVEPGTTPRFRPAILARGAGNLAREWLLTRPVRGKCTPGVDLDLDSSPPAGAREPETGAEAETQDETPTATPAVSLAAVPRTRREALGAAQAIQERAPVLRLLSSEHLRHLARPFFAAGWSPRDVLHAIDHDPGGRQHGYTSGVRSPAGWIRSRLAAWSGPNGVPLPSRSQRLAEARRQVLADQAARRARDADARAAAADYPAAASRAREMLMRRPRPQTFGMPSASR